MTGPDHYQHAERLLVEAARMMSTEIVAEERAEHIPARPSPPPARPRTPSWP